MEHDSHCFQPYTSAWTWMLSGTQWTQLKIIVLDMFDNVVLFANTLIRERLRSKIDYSRESGCRDTTRDEIMTVFSVYTSSMWMKEDVPTVLNFRARRKELQYRFYFTFSYKLSYRELSVPIIFAAVKNEKKLTKSRPFVHFIWNPIRIVRIFTSLVEFVIIDEMPIGFWCLRYCKPIKYGLKVYALCDSKTFYTWDIELYCGTQKPLLYLKYQTFFFNQ